MTNKKLRLLLLSTIVMVSIMFMPCLFINLFLFSTFVIYLFICVFGVFHSYFLLCISIAQLWRVL